MRKNRREKATGLTRRQALTCAAATFGFGLATGKSLSAEERLAATLPGAKVCILTPEAVEGPFYFDPKLVRADITERRRGAPLALTLQVASVKDCARLKGARVDLWHADDQGMYSGYRGQGDDGPAERASCAARNSLMPTVRCASPPSIQAGIQAARRTSTSRFCSTRQASSPASFIFLMIFRRASMRA